jgi:uncharacterized protein YcfJ
MYQSSTLRRTLVIGGVFFTALLALIGWTRHEGAPSAATAAIVPGVAHVFPAVYRGMPAGIEPVVARRRYTSRRRRYRVVVRRRPFSHSAAIVGGSAVGGALIGGLAGGGKGAAVGALVGGAGGYIYDRKTHKKRYIVRR